MARSAATPTQLHDVLDAVTEVSADLSTETLLERILGVTARLVGARYGYLEVLDQADRRLGGSARFGIDEAGLRSTGPLPPARQLLVELIERHHGRGVSRRGGGDQAEFICVPIQMQGEPFANVYLTDKIGGSGFSREDHEEALALGSAAGVLIENAGLREQGDRQSRWLAAVADITATLRGPISRATALHLVADRARDVTGADFVALLMSADEDKLVVEAVSGVPDDGLLGEHIDKAQSLAGDATRTLATIVIPDTEREPGYEAQKPSGWPDLGSVMVLPLSSDADSGALVVGWLKGHQTDRSDLDPAWPQRFADQAALVLQVARAQEDQGRLAVFEDRDRIGRDLHDLVIQRLFAIGLMLDNTTKLVSSSGASARIASAIDELDATIKDIRRAIFELNGTTRSDDLRTSLSEVVDHAAGALGFRPELVLRGPVDSVVVDDMRDHLLAVLAEALSNVVRHAGASRVVVTLDVGAQVELTVTDDGGGLSSKRSGSGVRNLRHRAKLLGGTCVVKGAPGGGAELRWSVPR